MSLPPISPVELTRDVLKRLGYPDLAPAGIVVGPASDHQQQLGVVSIVAAGLPMIERYTSVQWVRVQMRCLAGTLAAVEEISQGVQRDLHGRVRTVGRMPSTNERFLIHLINVTAGPSHHYDSPETYEALLFAELMIGTVPIAPFSA